MSTETWLSYSMWFKRNQIWHFFFLFFCAFEGRSAEWIWSTMFKYQHITLKIMFGRISYLICKIKRCVQYYFDVLLTQRRLSLTLLWSFHNYSIEYVWYERRCYVDLRLSHKPFSFHQSLTWHLSTLRLAAIYNTFSHTEMYVQTHPVKPSAHDGAKTLSYAACKISLQQA